MKLYQTIDGTMIGFYQERGGEVQAVIYRDVYEEQLITKYRQEEVITRPYYRIDVTTIAGYWDEQEVYVQGHYEREMFWFPEYTVTRYREIPGHYETDTEWIEGHYETQYIWIPEYYVTRYYWREAHPARGLEAAWIPYQELIPSGYKDQRVWVEGYEDEYEYWVDTYTESYLEVIPAGEKETRVWVDGHYVTERFWVPEQTITERVWIPPSTTMVTVEYKELGPVLVGKEPVYEYVDESQVRLFEVVQLVEAPLGVVGAEDAIVLRNMLTGDELTTTATYIGLASRIADNEYVVPR